MTPTPASAVLRRLAAHVATLLVALPCVLLAQEPTLRITITPRWATPDSARLSVSVTATGVRRAAGEELFDVPLITAGEPGPTIVGDRLVVIDARGPVALTVRDDESDAGGFVKLRHFVAARAVEGTLTVGYEAAVPSPGAPRRSGPPFDLRSEANGIGGAGFGLLILPVDTTTFTTTLRWDVRRMPRGTRAVTSFGAGTVRTHTTVDALRSMYFLVGELRHFPGKRHDDGFNAWWLGDPHFNAVDVMRWTQGAHRALAGFFRDSSRTPFTMFGRPGSIRNSGGAALTNSFMISFGTEPETETYMHFLLAHEMAHNWIGELDGPAGTMSWFSEGLADFYRLRLPFVVGLIDVDTYAAELSQMTRAYYENPRIRLANDSIQSGFWKDGDTRRLPYQRGFMYFATLDATIRRVSGGTRSLDTVLLAMIESRKAHRGNDTATWLRLASEAVGAESAAAVRAEFEAMLTGAIMSPPDEAFGPCLHRVPRSFAATAGYEWVRTAVASSAVRCVLP